MRTLLVAAILGVVLNGVSSHQLKWGSCRPVTPMADFDPERFSGDWYVIKKLVTSSPCMSASFGVEGDDVLTIQEIQTPLISQMASLDMTVTNVGKLTMSPSNKASMKLNWQGNPVSGMVSTSYAIVGTDYNTYALDVECQSFTIFHRLSATIYSRTKTLPQETIDMLERRLVSHQVDLDRMSAIDHTNCLPLENNDFNIKLDDNGLSLLGLMKDENIKNLKTIEEVGEYARENVPRL